MEVLLIINVRRQVFTSMYSTDPTIEHILSVSLIYTPCSLYDTVKLVPLAAMIYIGHFSNQKLERLTGLDTIHAPIHVRYLCICKQFVHVKNCTR